MPFYEVFIETSARKCPKMYNIITPGEDEIDAKANAVSVIPPAKTRLKITVRELDLTKPFVTFIGGGKDRNGR